MDKQSEDFIKICKELKVFTQEELDEIIKIFSSSKPFYVKYSEYVNESCKNYL